MRARLTWRERLKLLREDRNERQAARLARRMARQERRRKKKGMK